MGQSSRSSSTLKNPSKHSRVLHLFNELQAGRMKFLLPILLISLAALCNAGDGDAAVAKTAAIKTTAESLWRDYEDDVGDEDFDVRSEDVDEDDDEDEDEEDAEEDEGMLRRFIRRRIRRTRRIIRRKIMKARSTEREAIVDPTAETFVRTTYVLRDGAQPEVRTRRAAYARRMRILRRRRAAARRAAAARRRAHLARMRRARAA